MTPQDNLTQTERDERLDELTEKHSMVNTSDEHIIASDFFDFGAKYGREEELKRHKDEMVLAINEVLLSVKEVENKEITALKASLETAVAALEELSKNLPYGNYPEAMYGYSTQQKAIEALVSIRTNSNNGGNN